jgi:IS5 family transposase
MKQMTLMTDGFRKYNKMTPRVAFLADMECVVPRSEFYAMIESVYPQAGSGRPPVGLERMLRMYSLAHWFNLSDQALYESVLMRAFVGINLGREPVRDKTAVCKFRHLLERQGLGRRLFEQVGRHLSARRLKGAGGTIVDTTIINAPFSTKNQSGECDPDVHQTK